MTKHHLPINKRKFGIGDKVEVAGIPSITSALDVKANQS
jgi:hypothetical protein